MSFEEWLRLQLPSMLRLATALSGSSHAAEDLVQDVTIKAHASWGRIRALDHPEAYLRRMVINEHLSWRRQLARALRRDAKIEPDGSGRRPFDQEWVERTELATEIKKLPPRQRAVIVLRYLDDLTISETAASLGCTQSTVRAYTTRALATLRITVPDADPPTLPVKSRRPHLPVKDHHAH